MFYHISKNFKVRQKYSATRRIFNSLFGVGNVVKHGLSCLIHNMKTLRFWHYRHAGRAR